MLHGPCGASHPYLPCMQSPKCPHQCVYSYPQSFYEHTILRKDQYPMYKRPDDGRCYQKHPDGYIYTNRDVVPNMRELILMMNAHVCVEHVFDAFAFGYFYEYCLNPFEAVECSIIDDSKNKKAPQTNQTIFDALNPSVS